MTLMNANAAAGWRATEFQLLMATESNLVRSRKCMKYAQNLRDMDAVFEMISRDFIVDTVTIRVCRVTSG